MENLHNHKYFNQQIWILEHAHRLSMTALECVVLQHISLHNQYHEMVQLAQLALKCNVTIKQMDDCLTKLIQRGWVSIDALGSDVNYHLEGLFNQSMTEVSSETSDIVELYEREFKRPLSAHEIEKINDWLMKVDHGFLIHALREAVIYRKLNFSYIDRILVQWMNDHVTLELLNAGKRNER